MSWKRTAGLTLIGLTIPLLNADAKCGGVDYSWGAEALALMHDFVVTVMTSVVYLCGAIGAVCAVIAVLQIYIKMNTGEQAVTKSIMTLVGAALFFIGAAIVLPAIFGYRLT